MPLHGTRERRCRAEGLCGILSASDCCLCKGFRNLEHAGSVLGCSQGLSGHVQDRFASRNGPYCLGGRKARETKRLLCLTACGDQPANGGRTTVKIAARPSSTART